jgi:alpha-amylase
LIKHFKGKFKVSFSLTGVVMDQLERYAPDVLDSFKELAETGMVEFLSETYSHSLASLSNKEEFMFQVESHRKKVKELFGVETTSFRNTEIIYSDEIGSWVSEMGFKSILTEGAKHVLGWRSPNFMYCNATNPKLKVLLRNFELSDDIAFRFSNREWSEWPLTVDKYVDWINTRDEKAELINLFLDYETFGEHQKADTGIFEFLKSLPGAIIKKTPFDFTTPTEIASIQQPISAIQIPNPISWADEERDLTAWLGNDLQDAAFKKLYGMADKIRQCKNEDLLTDWKFLQVSDHFYYMCTKFFSDGAVHAYFNPYESPYDAFMNYMNVLSDFEMRIDTACPGDGVEKETTQLRKKLETKDKSIEKLEKEVSTLRRKLKKITVKGGNGNGQKTNKVKGDSK